jgi:hypothetical protein
MTLWTAIPVIPGKAPGSLVAGFLARQTGAPWTVFIGGLCCLGGAFFFAGRLPTLKKLARPIYIKTGIIAELAIGIQNAAKPLIESNEPMAARFLRQPVDHESR